MDIEIVVAILSSSFLSMVVSSLINKRKSDADINKINADIERGRRLDLIESEKKIDEKMSRLVEEQRASIFALNNRILQLQKESREAKERENHLESEIDELRACVDRYREQANRRKEENAALKREIEQLRKSVRGLS